MPVPLTYPGVYIEEISSGVRTIVGVSTSVTAFIGYTPKGPLNKATQVFNYGEFERIFGELNKDNELGYAVRQFFFNGGSEALIVRVAKGAGKASVIMQSKDKVNVLEIKAKSEGLWGNNLRLDIDYDTENPDSTFNLIITELKQRGKSDVLTTETYHNMSMDSNSPKYVVNVIKTSKLIEISPSDMKPGSAYEQAVGKLKPGWSLSGDLSKYNQKDLIDENNHKKRFISLIVDGEGPYEVAIFEEENEPPKDLDSLRANIETAINYTVPAKLKGVKVTLANALADDKGTGLKTHLLLTSNAKGTSLEHSSIRVFNASSNNASQVLKLGISNGGREREAASDLRPVQTGTTSGDLSSFDLTNINQTQLKLNLALSEGKNEKSKITIDLFQPDSIGTLSSLADALMKKIKTEAKTETGFSSVTVQIIGNRLRFTSGLEGANLLVMPTGDLAKDNYLKFEEKPEGATVNVQKYDLGIGENFGAQLKGEGGNDGIPPDISDIPGSSLKKTGMYSLEEADIFNLLCIPMVSRVEDETKAKAVIDEAVRYCEIKRAFMIIDPPKNKNTLSEIKEWMNKLPKSSHAALYYPQVNIPDPVDEFRLNPFPPSGTIAGLYARTDSTRGVWKAPAGIDATLNNVQAMDYNLTDAENGDLNKRGINCLRNLTGYGRVSWGARTLLGGDQLANEWKYIPVRRLALYIEESLFRALKWVVFEPNDEPLWSQIRLNVGAFMHSLFRQGAFQGTTPRESYFVKCDKETTTQDDINKGIVNIVVGFAPLKPAEFVVIKLQQMAGEIQT